MGIKCVDRGVRNHIKQCLVTIKDFLLVEDNEAIIPKMMPVITIRGARAFAPDLKFGSHTGIINIQLVNAPPVMARIASTITLKDWVTPSDEYCAEGLHVWFIKTYTENRVE